MMKNISWEEIKLDLLRILLGGKWNDYSNDQNQSMKSFNLKLEGGISNI